MISTCKIKTIARRFLQACLFSGALAGTACAEDHAVGPGGKAPERARRVTDADFIGLALSPDVAQAVWRHTALADALVMQPDVDKACSLAHSAQQLTPLLRGSLQSLHSAVLSWDLESGLIAALHALDKRLERADEVLIGIGLALGAETLYGYVRYDEIADASTARSGEEALFRAVAGLWRNPTGWPVYIEQQTDVQGCDDPGLLIAPLEQIGSAWERAPACARSAVIDVVLQSVGAALSDTSCYCHTQEESIADTTRLAELADSLGFGLSKPEADALQTHLRGDDVRFECHAN